MDFYELLIIGAGPAGLFCAIEAAAGGASVCILEKNNTPGKKLLISGSGRCNVTHTGEPADFMNHFGSAERFLRPALYGFTGHDLIEFLRERGCPVMTTDEGKIFPASEKAADILVVLLTEAAAQGVTIIRKEKVEKVHRDSNGFLIETATEKYAARNLAITTGGMSYPGTGSTGDGYRLARSLGHTVVQPRPALTPLIIKDYRYRDCAGISIPRAAITLYRENKKTINTTGDILFTHRGLSGPGILDFSRHITPGDRLTVSLVPDLQRHELEKILIEKGRKGGKTSLKNTLTETGIPERLARLILEGNEIPGDMKMGEVSRLQRGMILELLTAHPFTVQETGSFHTAMVTAGGIMLSEINPKTMESKIVPGLYFAGEVMDIDGDTGGYNLQAAFSTGILAGRSFLKGSG